VKHGAFPREHASEIVRRRASLSNCRSPVEGFESSETDR